jgi:glycosyltransferase involved in cell wall biosynthesis
MEIAINVEVAFSNLTGMGRYARELLRHLLRIDAEHSYTMFHSNQYTWPPNGDGWELPTNFRVQRLPYSRKQLLLSWFLYGGPCALGKFIGAYRVYHDLADILFPIASGRRIASLHDPFTLMFPRSCAWHSRMLFRKSQRHLCHADAIITVSNYSKRKIVELLRVPPEKVHVIYGGVGGAFCPVEDFRRTAKTIEKLGIREDYFLFVGVFNRRKNLGSLLRAYRIYRSRHSGDRTMLVCCGKPGVGSEEFFRDIQNLGLSEDVALVQAASDVELAELMSRCRALILPSLGEGFGLPVAEAMACGAPVICGDRCAMREVAGDAALCVDPTDIEQIADAMERVTSDGTLVKTLRERGFERAKQFSWMRTALQTKELYQTLL